jgi:hypothetical protein
MAKSTRRTTKAAASSRPTSATVLNLPSRPTNTEIARRAFELFCERGGQAGRDIDDWLRAERELQEASA